MEKEKDVMKELVSWIMYLLLVIGVSFLIVIFVGQRTKVQGRSMETTLSDGDNLIVDKISYRFRDPKRFEIIVFPYQYQENTYYIKRIIGLPGETIQIKDGYIYINGELLEEDYGAEVMNQSGIAADPIELGEDEYFVLGDNRNHSADSRDPSVGVLKRDQLMGRAFVRIWPLGRVGFISHE